MFAGVAAAAADNAGSGSDSYNVDAVCIPFCAVGDLGAVGW
jgi:hypothetical protein